MRVPHVLVLPSWYPTPDAPQRGVFFKEQAHALQKAGVRIGVAYPELRRLRTLLNGAWTRNRFQTSVTREEGIPTVRFHGWNPPSAQLRGRLFVNVAHRLIAVYGSSFGTPDLIHAHSGLWAGVAAARIQAQRGLPYLVTEHSTAFARDLIESWQKAPLRRAYCGAERVLTVSDALAEQLSGYVDRERMQTVPNMVDTDFFTLPPGSRNSSPFVFLTVAALRPKKGIDVLLRAFQSAFPADAETRLRIVGGGPLAEELEEMAASLEINDRVDFVGTLARDGVRKEMWNANVAVVPSRVETFGVAVIEAMATGLPVVATRSGGPEEILTAETGRLVDPDDVGQLAAALRWAEDMGESFCLQEEAIRNVVREKYSRDVVTERLRTIYQKILGTDDTSAIGSR